MHDSVLAGDLEGCVPVVLFDTERLLLLLGELACERPELVPRDHEGPAPEGAVARRQPDARPMGGQFGRADLRQDGRLEVGSDLLERGIAQPLDAGGVFGDPRLQPLAPGAGVERVALTELAGDLLGPQPLTRLAGPLAGVGHHPGDRGVAEQPVEHGADAGERGCDRVEAMTDAIYKPGGWRLQITDGGMEAVAEQGRYVYRRRRGKVAYLVMGAPIKPVPSQLIPQDREHPGLRSGE
jgi:hypothetical protein